MGFLTNIYRLSVLGVLALVSLSAFAMPKVKDFAQYDVTITPKGGGASVSGTLSLELTDFNPSTGQYTEKATSVVAGQSESSDRLKNASEFLTDNTVTQILADCAAVGGTAEKLTVGAGSFDTCGIAIDDAQNSGKVWMAAVTFGYVKQDITQKATGSHSVMSLTQFKSAP